MSVVANAVVGALGGPLGVGGAAISNAIGIPMSGGVLGNALGIGPSNKGKPRQAAETTMKIGEVPRSAIIGEAATAGSLVDAFNYGGKYGTDWEVVVLALADHRCEALTGFYVNDQYVAFGGDGMVSGFNDQLQVFWRPGTEAQTVPSILTTNGPGWTANDNGAGVCWVAVAYKADDPEAKEPTWPGGRPSFLFVLKGLCCYDARLDSTVAGGSGDHRWDDPATREWTDNLIVGRYTWSRGLYACDRVDEPDMLLIGRGLSDIEQPPAAMFAPANLCDEDVDGSPRYRANGTVYADQAFVDVEEMFALACAGQIVQRSGAVEIVPGQAKSSVASFTDADFIVGTSREFNRDILSDADKEWVNTIVPVYIEPAQKWAEHSAPVRRDIDDVLADGGPREETLSLSMVRHAAQAGRVGEIARRRGRLPGRGGGTLGPRFVALEEGDWVSWTSDRHFDGDSRLFEIGSYEIGADWRNKLSLRQISSAAFGDGDFLDDLAEAEQQDAPPAIGAPDSDAWDLAAEMLDDDGPAIPILAITGAVEDPHARQVRFEYWRDDGVTDPEDVTDWVARTTTGAGVTRIEISDIASGADYLAAVSYVVDGIPGDRLILGPVTAGSITASLEDLDPDTFAAIVALGDDLTDLEAVVDGKITTFYQSGTPTSEGIGDLWFKTSTGKWYRAASAGADAITAGEWVLTEDAGVGTAIAAAAGAQATADGKVTTFYQTSAPTAGAVGDLWIDSDETPKRVRRWSGSAWIVITPVSLAELDAAAAAAISTLTSDLAALDAVVDGKVTTFYGSSTPTSTGIGDLWFKTTTGKWYRAASIGADAITAGEWVLTEDSGVGTAITAAAGAQATADGKVTTFYQTSAPTAGAVGDLWVDSDETPKRVRRWSGSAWVVMTPASLAELDATAAATLSTLTSDLAALDAVVDGKVTTFYGSSTPTSIGIGDLWFKTNTGKWYRAASIGADAITAGEWVLTEDAGVGAAISAAAGAQATADGKVTTFYATSAPTPGAVGDLWIDSDETPKRVRRWSGSAWVVMTPVSLAELDAAAAAQLASSYAAAVAASDDQVWTIDEKVRDIVPAVQGFEDRYVQLTARATAQGISTTAVTAAWTALQTYLASHSVPWNDINQNTVIALPLNSVPLSAWVNVSVTNVANGIYRTLNDASTGVVGFAGQDCAVAGSQTYTFAIPIKKDAVPAATRFAMVRQQTQVGTSDNAAVRVNTQTGAIVSQTADVVYGAVLDFDKDNWLVIVTATLNANNTLTSMQVYPAAGSGVTDSATITGSINVQEPVFVLGDVSKIGRYIWLYYLRTMSLEIDKLAKAISERDGTTALKVYGPATIDIPASSTGDASASLPFSSSFTSAIGTGTVAATFTFNLLSGSWGVLDSPSLIDRELGRSICRRIEAEGLRVTAIRRPGRRAETPRWRWFIAHCEEGSEALYGGEVDDARGYLDIALDGSDGERVDGPLVAVCAHGKHDQCCAVRGRSAASAIAAEYPEFTWECSHLGGDRFAATMLILPEGLCYGRVDSTDSAGLVAKYLDGRLDHRYLRGRTSLPHPVQAAQYFARESLGEDRIHALSPLKVEHAEHQIRVELRTDSGSVNVVLAEKMSEPLLSMCRATVAGSVRTFELVSISSD